MFVKSCSNIVVILESKIDLIFKKLYDDIYHVVLLESLNFHFHFQSSAPNTVPCRPNILRVRLTQYNLRGVHFIREEVCSF